MNVVMRAGAAAVLALGLSACGSSSSPSSPSPAPSGGANSVSVPVNASTLGSSAYAPNPITVTSGTTVTWTNNDSIAHTSTSDGGAWDSGSIAAGGHFSFTFQNKGNFAYHCTIHPGMIGTVVVQ